MENKIHEKLRVAVLMAITAGFMDGFTFFHYGGRFAGAQTGNIIQAGINIAQGNWDKVGNFVIPILFFLLGAMFKYVYTTYLNKRNYYEPPFLLGVQIIGLILTTILYATILHLPDSLFVGILSFFMAIQLDTFAKTHGVAYGSIISTGNLKSLGINLTQWLMTRDRKFAKNMLTFTLIVGGFFVGAILATLVDPVFGPWTLMGTALILLIVFFIIQYYNERKGDFS